MRLGVMQPYFFPYLGHFSLIAACDQWVVFDVSQYTPKSWMSRNRVLHPNSGTNYISVSLSNSSINIKTNEARIADWDAVRLSVIGELTHYRRAAPYYRRTMALVEEVFSDPVQTLVDLNVRALRTICRVLEINFNPVLASSLSLDVGGIDHAGAWAPMICQVMGADEYINPISGAFLFRPQDFKCIQVELRFLDFTAPGYEMGSRPFEANLSILDVLMWNDLPVIRQWLTDQMKLVCN